MPRGVIAGPHEYIFSSLKLGKYFSEWLYIILDSQQQRVRNPVSPHPQMHLLLSIFFFNFSYSNTSVDR